MNILPDFSQGVTKLDIFFYGCIVLVIGSAVTAIIGNNGYPTSYLEMLAIKGGIAGFSGMFIGCIIKAKKAGFSCG